LAWAAAGDAASFGMSLVRNTARAAAEGETGAGLDQPCSAPPRATTRPRRAGLRQERRAEPQSTAALLPSSRRWLLLLARLPGLRRCRRARRRGGVEVPCSRGAVGESGGSAILTRGSREHGTRLAPEKRKSRASHGSQEREGFLVRWSLVEEQWKEIKHRLPACGELEPLNWPISNTPTVALFGSHSCD